MATVVKDEQETKLQTRELEKETARLIAVRRC